MPSAVAQLARAKAARGSWHPDLSTLWRLADEAVAAPGGAGQGAGAGVAVPAAAGASAAAEEESMQQQEEQDPAHSPFGGDGRMGLPGTLHRWVYGHVLGRHA